MIVFATAQEAVAASNEGLRVIDDSNVQAEEGAKRRGERAPEKVLSVTVSIGLAAPGGGQPPREVLKAADEALYRAKKGGRNRVSR